MMSQFTAMYTALFAVTTQGESVHLGESTCHLWISTHKAPSVMQKVFLYKQKTHQKDTKLDLW